MMRMTVTGSVLLALLTGTAAAQSGQSAQSRQDREATDVGSIAEDIEIMERIIAKALAKHFADAAKATDESDPESITAVLESSRVQTAEAFYALTLASGARQTRRSDFNVEGFYVPGVGAMFTLNLPTLLEEVDPPKEEDKSTGDLWTEAEDELRGKTSGAPWGVRTPFKKARRRKYAVDQEDLDSHLDTLFRTIGKYGSRIEQLGAGDAIVLAIRIKGRTPTGKGVNLAGSYRQLLFTSTGSRTTSDRVVVRIPMSAVKTYESGRSGLRDIKQASDVAQYRAAGSALQQTNWRNTTDVFDVTPQNSR